MDTTRRASPPRQPAAGRRGAVLGGAGAVALLVAGAVRAQAGEPFPTRPVRLVVSYAGGNVADLLARVVAQALSDHWKQSVLVENRPGQGGSLGAQVVAKSPPDGYTLLFSAMAALAINPHVYGRVGYDPIADFAPIGAVARTGNGILYGSPDLKASTLPELIALSKASPGTLNYGTQGNGTVPHLNMEALKSLTGLDVTHVPYKATMAVLNDVVGGRIQIASEAAGVVLPHLKSGKIKAIAIVGTERMPELPGVAAITEHVPDFDPIRPWMGVLAPAGTPPARVAQIADGLQAVLAQPEVRERIVGLNLHVLASGPADFAIAIRRDVERFGPMVKALKLQAD